MYSVVLLAAITVGGETADFGRHGGCHGCYGGCWGGCYGGYSYGGWGCCGGYSYGCCGGYSCGGYSYGCCGSYGCYGGTSYGCCGSYGCYGGTSYGCCGSYGCYGGTSYGCCGSYGCYGGTSYGCCGGMSYGGTVGVPMQGGSTTPAPTPVPAPTPDKEKDKKKKVTPDEPTAAPATLIVTVPANAKLLVDGTATRATSTVRTFASPALPMGKKFAYTLEAKYQRDGKTVTVTRRVPVTAGATVNVDLTRPTDASVASR